MASVQEMQAFLAIGAAALTTYALRLGGLLLANCLPQHGRFRTFMDALPGTLLVSLVAPNILAAGSWGFLAAACTAALAAKTKNLFLAMLVGMTIVGLARHLFPG
ncbi:AzlD family protein [Desulfosoma caldarium]|uniref:Putative membrane protein n=1 Tax=Desulfosoma caldarium TaxID=610254 RepID=A0A3N1UMZ6_9BACT|nr:AzlD domain-containing protein [Desulfosoma caldarium]ROQ89827.1 putative membrane protein [Desulfosoma caldarium]